MTASFVAVMVGRALAFSVGVVAAVGACDQGAVSQHCNDKFAAPDAGGSSLNGAKPARAVGGAGFGGFNNGGEFGGIENHMVTLSAIN